MSHIAVIGAGITGVTTAYALVRQGFQVTVIDRLRYPAMETSFANGGQLSACNAEVWNSRGTIMKGLKWMMRKDAPCSSTLAPAGTSTAGWASSCARSPATSTIRWKP